MKKIRNWNKQLINKKWKVKETNVRNTKTTKKVQKTSQ